MKEERVYKDLIWQHPDRVSGAVCFYGTRLPVQHMFDHLKAGYTLEKFCSSFHLAIEHAQAVLDLASEGLGSYLQEAA